MKSDVGTKAFKSKATDLKAVKSRHSAFTTNPFLKFLNQFGVRNV
jgi:hypothetical protein